MASPAPSWPDPRVWMVALPSAGQGMPVADGGVAGPRAFVARPEGGDAGLAVSRAGHADGVDGVPLGGEAEVLRGVGLGIGVVKGAADDLGGAFADGFP